MRKSIISLMMLVGVGLILSGCSFSKWSKHSSKSSSSPLRWSSRSSRGGRNNVQTAAKSYSEEIAALTVLYTKSGGTATGFQRELGIVSGNHGIVNWENDTLTYESIGIGLKQYGVSDQSIKNLPFLQTDNFIDHYSEIISGYYSS